VGELRNRVVEALRKTGYFRGIKRIAARRKAAFVERVRAATAAIERHEAWLEEHPGQDGPRAQFHVRRLRAAHIRRGRLYLRLTFWRKRYVWARNRDEFWTELLAARRRKLKAAQGSRKIDAADFENSMTGSHEYWTLTPAAKAAIAIGVIRFGLWVSSTYRPETPGSHHAEDPTRGADLAGEWDSMIAYQRWLYRNHLGAMLELYGPHNTLCADNGQPAPQAEGSFNENLHDSHDHVFLADPSYPLAFEGAK
jgi:hypothetical protein